jgi:O-succinylbenzoate synthase
MKIDAAELYHVAMRLQRPFETSFGVEQDRHCLLIRLEAEGLTGWGECVAGKFPGFSYETAGTAWHMIEDHLLPAVLGREFSGATELPGWTAHIQGHPMAKAGLELAAWDLQAQEERNSLAELLGADRAQVPVGVSIGIQREVDTLLQIVEQHAADGYQRVKLKIKPGRDLEPVGAVRGAYPDLALQVDANAGYSPAQSETLEALDEFGLVLIEQPYAKDELLAHAALQDRISTPICLDEGIESARQAEQALALDACRIINIKAGRVGGLTEAVAIHDLCIGREVPVWCGGMLETGIGRAANLALAGLPGFTLPGDISATDRYYERDIAEPRFALNADGTISVPNRPGLGVDVDLETLERFTLRKQRITN